MYTGKELVRVHVEKFKDRAQIEFRHGFEKGIYIQCWNQDGTMIFPKYIKRMERIKARVYLNNPTPGAYVTVLQQSEQINFRTQPLVNGKEFTLEHKMGADDFLIQCWNGIDEIVYPSDIKKLDDVNLYIRFAGLKNFNGYVNMFGTYPTYIQTVIKEASDKWKYKIREKESMKHVGLQTKYEDGTVFMPKNVLAVDPDADLVFDNAITINLNSATTGKITALVTGLKV